jgi:PAS domain S-box-containing protein
VRVVLALAGATFVSEFLIMLALESLPRFSRLVENLIDATVLATVLSAVVVVVVVRPLRRHIAAQVDQVDSLVRHQEWLGRVFESVDESIVVTDAAGVIEHVNPSFTRRMGWTLNEVRGQRPSMFASGTHPPEQYQEMWQRLKTSGVWQGRVVDKAKDGTLHELLMAISPLRSSSGEIRGYVALHRDLGDLLAHEQELQRTLERVNIARDEAVESSEAKSRFLSTMSHEIRTPLAGVLGTLELLDKTELAPAQREYSGLALRSARALLALLNDVLDFSKMDARGVTLLAEPFDLSLAVRDVRELFLAQAQQQRVQLTVVGVDAPQWVQGDQVRLKQVLSNLVGNAVKFTRDGAVTVRVTAREDGTMVRLQLAVEDTGIGIPKEHQAALFQPFRQVDATTSRRFGGTGLGLAISRHLVEAMGGALTLESVEGKGSTFTTSVALPRVARVSAELGAVLTQAERTSVAGLRVLVAEDNPVNQLVLSRLLQRLGCVVSLVANGQEALERLGGHQFDAVLMDMQMPVMDGLEATRRARQLRTESRLVPIVALTANAFAEDRTACLEAGMNDFLSKPVQESQLVRTLLAVKRHPPLTRAEA